MDRFLYEMDFRHERVNVCQFIVYTSFIRNKPSGQGPRQCQQQKHLGKIAFLN